jgi:hypothetical protein
MIAMDRLIAKGGAVLLGLLMLVTHGCGSGSSAEDAELFARKQSPTLKAVNDSYVVQQNKLLAAGTVGGRSICLRFWWRLSRIYR